MGKRGVVLFSGGLDSTTLLALVRERGYEPYPITFLYGQRHSTEVERASKIAEIFNVRRHLIFDLDLRKIGGSSLTDEIEVPKNGDIGKGIPSTYVPARNTIFLSIALGWAEALGAESVFIGVNSIDYSGYPDCRPQFIKAFQQVADLGTKRGAERIKNIEIKAPFINMTKAEIIKMGISLNVDFALTHSCYDPIDDNEVCGKCDSCLLRKRGFEQAGIKDPALKVG